MNRQRKSHRKSREGCEQCKERHVKCNEFHPQCQNCERYSFPCSFSSSVLRTTPLNEDSVADLELLEFWHRNPLTADFSDANKQFEYDFVRLGFSHHYLLNSILALAALQLFDQDRSRLKWYARAAAHQDAALTRARPHLQSLEDCQRLALVGFAAFTTMYAVAEPLVRPVHRGSEFTELDPVGELLRAIRLGRSTTAFVRNQLAPQIKGDPMVLSKFAPHRPENVGDVELRFPQLTLLRDLVESHCETEQKPACIDAAVTLFEAIAWLMDN
ncbi:hypothetical protein Daus18300_010505 [Diaporthe australafricana]|uniref:Zn(2)-C6 fungal-type domain-containing protein n=1 Tax=Diaporthe australafricana TaxID=127596 RepID=A0ABR3WAE1_9PEZI